MRDYHASALLAGPVAADRLASTRLVVNLFDGGPRSKVELSVAGGPTEPMRQTERLDPFVVEVYARNADTKKPSVESGVSSHIWQATLSGNLEAGTHRLDVRATDEHGREHAASMVLEVTA
jgi:hypothetical protein